MSENTYQLKTIDTGDGADPIRWIVQLELHYRTYEVEVLTVGGPGVAVDLALEAMNKVLVEEGISPSLFSIDVRPRGYIRVGLGGMEQCAW